MTPQKKFNSIVDYVVSNLKSRYWLQQSILVLYLPSFFVTSS